MSRLNNFISPRFQPSALLNGPQINKLLNIAKLSIYITYGHSTEVLIEVENFEYNSFLLHTSLQWNSYK